MLRLGLVGVLLTAGATLSGGQAGRQADPARGPDRVTLLRAPGGGIQPQAAADASGTVHVVYFKGDPAHGDVFYTRLSHDRFAPDIRVNSEPGSAIATGSVRGAHLAIGADGRVHVAWIGSAQTHAQSSPAPILYARLADGGRRFEPQRNLMRTPAIGPDGASIAADAAGHVHVFWHALAKDGKDEADRRLWLATSDDDGATFAVERPVSDPAFGACACCGTAAFASRDGALFALFRSAREAVHRDTFLLRSADRGATFTPIDVGPWDINACPMSTYVFAQHPSSGSVVAAWETDGLVHWGRPRTAAVWDSLRAGGDVKNQKHPAIAVSARGGTLVAWIEGSGWSRGGALAWQVFDRDLNGLGVARSVPGVPAWDLATAFSTPDGGFTIVY